VMLLEVVTNPLVERFGDFSLCNQITDFKLGSASNSTPPWIVTSKPAPEPSCETTPLHEHFLYGLCNSSTAHAEALTTRRADKEIASEYSSDSYRTRLQLGLPLRVRLWSGPNRVRDRAQHD
jgi:hypothetical protein